MDAQVAVEDDALGGERVEAGGFDPAVAIRPGRRRLQAAHVDEEEFHGCRCNRPAGARQGGHRPRPGTTGGLTPR